MPHILWMVMWGHPSSDSAVCCWVPGRALAHQPYSLSDISRPTNHFLMIYPAIELSRGVTEGFVTLPDTKEIYNVLFELP
jgi:hypothetical protein